MTNSTNPFASNGAAPSQGGTFIIPNMDHIEERGLYAPPGIYPATVIGFKIMTSKQGNEMLEFSLKINTPNGDIKKLHFCPTSANALWKLKRIARALDLKQGAIDASIVTGKKCNVVLIDEGEFKGKKDCAIEGLDPPTNTAGLTTTGNDEVPF